MLYPQKIICALLLPVVIGSLEQPLVAGQAIPGTGTRIEPLSDDFEDPDWAFDYSTQTSLNRLWKKGRRGSPEILERVSPPAGGLANQDGALRIRTVDQDDDGYPIQEDLVTAQYDKILSENPQRKDLPSVIARIFLPPSDPEGPAWSYIGLRMEARSTNQEVAIPRYYPSIWIHQSNDASGKSAYAVRVRLGDGPTRDQLVGSLPGPGWYTVGVAFDADGIGHYYIGEGADPLTPEDKIYDTSRFPGGSDPRLDYLWYHFFSIGGTQGPTTTADFRIDDVGFYTGSGRSLDRLVLTRDQGVTKDKNPK